MKNSSFAIFLAVVVLLAAILGLFTYFAYRPQSAAAPENSAPAEAPPLPERPVVRATDPVHGEESATLTIVEFGDFFCAACAQVQPVLDKLLAEFEGKVKLVWKDLPNIQRHLLAERAAQAARCAQEQNKFWQYHDLLFSRSSTTQITEENLLTFGQELGLDSGSFTECVQSGRTARLVEQSLNEGILLRVDATPYFFIGDKRFSGAIDEATLRSALNL